MKIRYKGGRPCYKVLFNRKPIYFTPENNKTVDIQDQKIVNHIFNQTNRAEFEVVIEESKAEIKEAEVKTEPKEDKLKCEVCGFIAKSSFGLSIHQNKHKGGK